MGDNWRATEAALGSSVFTTNCLLSFLLFLGANLGGTCCFSFVAFTTCHSRLHMRRKYNLPPACGLPERIDDCIVHLVSIRCDSSPSAFPTCSTSTCSTPAFTVCHCRLHIPCKYSLSLTSIATSLMPATDSQPIALYSCVQSACLADSKGTA